VVVACQSLAGVAYLEKKEGDYSGQGAGRGSVAFGGQLDGQDDRSRKEGAENRRKKPRQFFLNRYKAVAGEGGGCCKKGGC